MRFSSVIVISSTRQYAYIPPCQIQFSPNSKRTIRTKRSAKIQRVEQECIVWTRFLTFVFPIDVY